MAILTILKSRHFSSKLNLIAHHYLGLGILLSLIANPVAAQDVVAIDGDLAATPIVLSGNTSGNLKAIEISGTENTATGYCDGYINPQPNHLLKLDSFFDSLRLEVQSSADTTVLIKGNGGVWCNDDSGSANPLIEGQWQAGSYKVWVGSYQPDTSNSYQIRITGQ